MTVMLNTPYFGIPQSVMRDGTWGRMKPSEQSFYTYLLHESERLSTRRFFRSDAQVRAMVPTLSSRTLRNARPKLQAKGLIGFKRGSDGFTYVIHNPATGEPWPGDPKQREVYKKKSAPPNGSAPDGSSPSPSKKSAASSTGSPSPSVSGIPMKFP